MKPSIDQLVADNEALRAENAELHAKLAALQADCPTLDDIRKWPATVGIDQACPVFGLSRSHGHYLAGRNEFPARVIEISEKKRRVITASLLRVVGYEELAA